MSTDTNNTSTDPAVREGDPLEEAIEVAAGFHPLGPNHAIRVNGVGYIYDPEDDLWHRGYTPTDQMGLPYSITAETIHDWTLTGTGRITTWDVSS